MKRFIIFMFIVKSMVWGSSTYAEKLKVVTAYPFIASVTEQITGDFADVQFLANGKWDPHFVVPRPSYISKLRDADLLIINGAELEVGWMPPLVSQASNSKLSGNGTLDLSRFVKLQEIPQTLSRAAGDVHPDGNPHYILNPENIIPVAHVIFTRISELDPDHAMAYKANFETFKKKWREKLKIWDDQMKKLKGISVIEYHGLYHYFLGKYGIKTEGTLERLPGIPPTPRHLVSLEKIIVDKKVKLILQDVYHSPDSAQMLAKKTNIRMVLVPHDVGAVSEAKDIFLLYDEIVRRMTND